MKNDFTFIDKWSKKIRVIYQLGGKCKKCGNDNIFHLCFHHINDIDKDFSICNNNNKRWSELVIEINKCELLCQNCHQELHFNEYDIENDHRNNKKIFLDYKGQCCEKCGYNKCSGALSFHHINPEQKLFRISAYTTTLYELNNYIKDELDKCQILCSNCHNEEHTHIEKFEKLKTEIYRKVFNYKEIQGKLDRNVVYEMYDSGIRQIEISKHFNASKGTISDIIKNRIK